MNATVSCSAHRTSALRQRGPRADARASRFTQRLANQTTHRHGGPARLSRRLSAYLAPGLIANHPPPLNHFINQSP
jgi:hypothetical protein